MKFHVQFLEIFYADFLKLVPKDFFGKIFGSLSTDIRLPIITLKISRDLLANRFFSE